MNRMRFVIFIDNLFHFHRKNPEPENVKKPINENRNNKYCNLSPLGSARFSFGCTRNLQIIKLLKNTKQKIPETKGFNYHQIRSSARSLFKQKMAHVKSRTRFVSSIAVYYCSRSKRQLIRLLFQLRRNYLIKRKHAPE